MAIVSIVKVITVSGDPDGEASSTDLVPMRMSMMDVRDVGMPMLPFLVLVFVAMAEDANEKEK